MVKVGDYVKMLGDSLKEHGIKDGDKLYLAGSGFVPKEENEYDYRLIFIAAKLIGDELDLESNGFTVDGDNLEPLSEFENARLSKVRDKEA